jgi:hypothetical protein
MNISPAPAVHKIRRLFKTPLRPPLPTPISPSPFKPPFKVPTPAFRHASRAGESFSTEEGDFSRRQGSVTPSRDVGPSGFVHPDHTSLANESCNRLPAGPFAVAAIYSSMAANASRCGFRPLVLAIASPLFRLATASRIDPGRLPLPSLLVLLRRQAPRPVPLRAMGDQGTWGTANTGARDPATGPGAGSRPQDALKIRVRRRTGSR